MGNESKAIVRAMLPLLLTTLIIAFMVFGDVASAQVLRKKTYAYIGVFPNPVGVNQKVYIHLGIYDPLANVALGWEGLTVTVERPDGKTETLGPLRTDSTGGTGTSYTPTLVGTYYLQTHFPEQTNPATVGNTPAGTIMEASVSERVALIVTEEQAKTFPDVSLPAEYWMRPINSQFRGWYSIAGVWLQRYPPHRFAANNDGPESPHILWAKQLAPGGIAGGELGWGISYDQGDAYVGKWINTVILNGAVYYNLYESRGGTNVEQVVVAVDLKSGEELWKTPLIGKRGNATGATVPSASIVSDTVGRRLEFGQLFYWDSYNLHGAYPLLWTVDGSTWFAFDALTGRWIYTVTNVPSGTTRYGENGRIYRLQVNLAARQMALWNLSALVSMEGSWDPHGNVYNASGVTATGALAAGPARAWVYNVTLPTLPGSVKLVTLNRVIGGTGLANSWQNATRVLWGVSAKPGEAGRLLFNTTWTGPEGVACDIRPGYNAISEEDGVFVISAKEKRQYYGFSIDTGQLLWGPTEPPEPYQNGWTMLLTDAWAVLHMAYGKMYTAGMGGVVNAYDLKTGKRVWTYEVRDPYTASEMFSREAGGDHWTIVVAFITDGKIYLEHQEHSPGMPRPRGAPFICLDAETGEEIFRVNGLFRSTWNGGNSIIGDSTIATFNTDDNCVYAVGKGPSATTATASPKVVANGQSVVIEGCVTDVSPGTNDAAIKLRFPNGVPAVADECMGEWMKYVYHQFPRPSNVTGVWVTFDAVSPEGKWIHVGGTNTDSSGMYSIPWTPPSEGLWTIVITFPGSKSYYASYAETTLFVTAAPPTPETPEMPEIPTPPDYTPILTALTILVVIAILIGVYSIYDHRKLRK